MSRNTTPESRSFEADLPRARLDASLRADLLRLAHQAIAQAAASGMTDGGVVAAEEALKRVTVLQEPAACFVTLTRKGELRGCIGTCEAQLPLLEAVAHYAQQAALHDPRFPPVSPGELASLAVEISVLTPMQALDASGPEELLSQLRPGVDGVWLEEGPRRATFLPQVWKTLPDPQAFLRHLLRKGGWPEAYWSPGLRCYRYQVEAFQDA